MSTIATWLRWYLTCFANAPKHLQQKIDLRIMQMSSLSTVVNTYQQLSTKALYINYSNIWAYPIRFRHWKPCQLCQQRSTLCNGCATESNLISKIALLFSGMSTLSTAVNSYQHLSTKTLYSNNEHIPKGLLTKNYVNTVNRDQHSATAMQQSQI